MKLKSIFVVTAAFAAGAFLSTGSAAAVELPKDANTTCPVMMEEKVDPDLFVDYKGERIYVCCTKCKRRFMKDPEKYLARVKADDKQTTVARKSKQISSK